MPPAISATHAAAVLAGGQAERLGGANKAALHIGAESILDREIGLLRQVADPVFIVSSRQDVPASAAGEPLRVPDALPGTGALGGIYTALMASPRARTIVVACDMPFLTLAFLQLLTRDTSADVIVPRTARGYEPLAAAWSRSCAGVIRRRLDRGQLKAALVFEELRVEELGPEVLAACDPHGLLFVNVNTPHDYERAQESARVTREDE
jgi:molybdopterin-guanine dinucleotide biosynthesis protein A